MTIRVGLLGAGMIADDHCRNINGYDGAAVVAVADLSKARREDLKGRYGIAKTYDDWKQLIADPGVDAITIALPNNLHAAAALAAVRANKHVLLEKPFAMNFGEANRVAKAAAKSKSVVMVGMNQRYSRPAQVMRTIVERGDIGEVYHVKAYMRRRMGAPKFGTWFVNKAQSGGGCLLDIGVHILDLGMFLSGLWKPLSVTGQTYSKFGHRGIGEGSWGKSEKHKLNKFDVDDSAMAFIRCEGGATIELNVSWVLHQESNYDDVELFGTEAGARLRPVRLFRLGTRKGEYEVVEPQSVQVDDFRANRQADWLDAIAGKRKPLCTMEQALVVQKLLDAIYKSSETGREVHIR